MQLLSVMLLGALASAASALPVDELVSKNIEARGGIDAIRAIHSPTSLGCHGRRRCRVEDLATTNQ